MNLNQLYEFYPIPGGCPHCKGSIIGIPSPAQRTGKQNLQVTNCPHCHKGIELIICDNKGGKLVEADLSKIGRPEAYQMKAIKSKTIVLNPGMMGKGADA